MRSLQYNFDDLGNLLNVDITLQYYTGRDFLTASVTILPGDLEIPIDEVSSNVLETVAKSKLIDWLNDEDEPEESELPIDIPENNEGGMPEEDYIAYEETAE